MNALVAVLTTSTLILLMAGSGTASATPDLEVRRRPPRRERALLTRLRPGLALLAGCGGWAMFGGPIGLVVGIGSAVAVWVVLGRTEDPAAVRRREQLVEDLPTGVDLLGSCLDAGAATGSALVCVSRALGGPVGEEFLAIHHRLDVGVDPVQVWRSVAAHPQLAPLGRALGRAHETGAPVGRAVHRLAEELRDRARAEVETRARSIEVKAAAPLGLCLLPAFVVLGVVPMVVGVFSSMQLFR
ncbi:MAG: type II secretion system F family protein [Marmoricola sp.]